ncbi:glycolipid transfer protein [Rhizophagus irregularis DAOM 181602=DAOM 197198]|nr:glycolipid transfer protein [Rhizophagus irregularis DAOM 181602=DAOM 197198]
MNGNIEKIRKCYDADPTKSHTLEKLVIDEQEDWNLLHVTLKPFHGMVVRPIFALAMKACPYRKDFFEKL